MKPNNLKVYYVSHNIMFLFPDNSVFLFKDIVSAIKTVKFYRWYFFKTVRAPFVHSLWPSFEIVFQDYMIISFRYNNRQNVFSDERLECYYRVMLGICIDLFSILYQLLLYKYKVKHAWKKQKLQGITRTWVRTLTLEPLNKFHVSNAGYNFWLLMC